MNYKVFPLILFCFCFVCSRSVAQAETVVKVGVYQNSPKIFMDESGIARGIFIDILEYIAEEEKWRFEYIPGSWQECLDRLENGDIELMPDVAYSDERAQRLNFTEQSVLNNWAVVYASKGSEIESVLDLEGMKVAVMKGDFSYYEFKAILKEFGINCTFIETSDFSSVFEIVSNDSADAGLISRLYGIQHEKNYSARQTPIICCPTNLYFATSKGKNSILINTIDKRLHLMKSDRQSVYYQSLAKWIGLKLVTKPVVPLWVWYVLILFICGIIVITSFILFLKLRIRNATEKINLANTKLRRYNRTLSMLSKCNLTLIRTEDELSLMNEICEIIVNDGGYKMAWIGFAEQDDEKNVRPIAQAGFEDGYLETANMSWADDARSRGPTGTAIRTGEYCIVKSTLENGHFAPWQDEVKKRGYASTIAIPLKVNEKTIGALNIYSVRRVAFDEEELNLLIELINNLAFGITSIRTVNARLQAEDELRRSEKKYKDLYENAPIAYFNVGVDGTIKNCNKRAIELSGYSCAELTGMAILNLYDDKPEGKEKASEIFARFITGESIRGEELLMQKKDGTRIWISLTVNPFKNDQGEIIESRSMVVDITQLKKVEENLLHRNLELTLLMEVSKTLVSTLEMNALLQALTDGVATLLGLPSAAIYTLNGEILRLCATTPPLPPEIPESFLLAPLSDHPHIKESLIKRRPVFLYDVKTVSLSPAEQKVVKTRDLRTILYLPLINENEVLGSLIVGTVGEPKHISDHKISCCVVLANIAALAIRNAQSYKSLQDSEAMLKQTQHISKVGGWEYNVDEKRFLWSDETYRIHGVSPDCYDPDNIENDISFYKGGDKRLIDNAFRRAIEYGEPYDLELRFRNAQGENLWVRTIGKVEKENGKTVRVYGNIMDITEHKQLEREREENLAKFGAVFNNSPIAYSIFDLDGKLIEVNPAFLRMTGHSYDQVIGKTTIELNLISSADQQRIREIANQDGVLNDYEFDMMRSDGTICPVSLSRINISIDERSYGLGIALDITDRKRAEEAIQASKNSLEEAQRIAHLGNWDLDLIDNKLNWSDEVYRIFNLEPQEFGATFEAFLDNIHPDDREMVNNAYTKSVRDKTRYNIVHRLLLEDGTIKYVNEMCETFYDNDGKPIRSVGTVQDITERKLVEEELNKHRKHLEELVEERTAEIKRINQELRHANISLQEADRLKSIFLASMSHELRTPLNSIIGFTGILLMGLSGELSDEQKKQLTLVKSSAHHLLELINDLLDISKIEAGKAELFCEEFELSSLITESVQNISVGAIEKGLELYLKIPSGIILFSDKRRVKQILINLLSNAVKFTSQGSVTIAAKILKEKFLQMRVTDTGIGIKKESLNRLFQPFQQVDASMTKKYEGTGLGLYLVKKLTNLLGGEISMKSEYGKGCEFTFNIPLKYEDQ